MSQKNCVLNKKYYAWPSYSAKNLNSAFQKYKSSVSPDVIERCDWMNKERQKVSPELMNLLYFTFFTGLAYQTEIASKGWNKLLYEDKSVGLLYYRDILEMILASTGWLSVFVSL